MCKHTQAQKRDHTYTEELETLFSKNIGETAMMSAQLSQTGVLASNLVVSPASLILFSLYFQDLFLLDPP